MAIAATDAARDDSSESHHSSGTVVGNAFAARPSAEILPFDLKRRRAHRQSRPSQPKARVLMVRIDTDVRYFPLLNALRAVGLTLKQDRGGLIITPLRGI
ncbi:MAG TPA: hypothetical protein VIT67_07160 [Povalibacter sp.]